jgi:outer membrane protein assembly factor BamA
MGQQVDVAALDEAAGRLLQTGLFTKLSYRYRTTGGAAVVTFVVEEARGSLPVVFDNFIWFTRDELAAAVRRELPSFEGSAPESQGAIASITKALTGLLATRHIVGQGEYAPATDESGAHPRHVFSVKGVRVPVCQLHFPGATDITESELVKNAKPLFEMDYSQETVAAFAVGSLLPLYHQRGHLRASFAEPKAVATGDDARADCKSGADVTIPVAEGLAYLWDKAEWAGADALGVAELDAALNMKPGAVADGLKIEQGWRAIHRAYGRKGYLYARLKSAPVFDDANRRVSYTVQLDQGAQFHMGSISVAGLAEADAARVARAWQLAPGAVFNMDYLEEFGKKLPALRLEGFGTRFRGYKTELKPNRQTQTVDVTLHFK